MHLWWWVWLSNGSCAIALYIGRIGSEVLPKRNIDVGVIFVRPLLGFGWDNFNWNFPKTINSEKEKRKGVWWCPISWKANEELKLTEEEVHGAWRNLHKSSPITKNEYEYITRKNCAPHQMQHACSQLIRHCSPYCRCGFYPSIICGQTNCVK